MSGCRLTKATKCRSDWCENERKMYERRKIFKIIITISLETSILLQNNLANMYFLHIDNNDNVLHFYFASELTLCSGVFPKRKHLCYYHRHVDLTHNRVDFKEIVS
uniref:(northern house mosquito) hypothetical protein n=1 Tax=Culex pipiens TaxID=7175 RepID=A0A8D8F1R8_CULPI